MVHSFALDLKYRIPICKLFSCPANTQLTQFSFFSRVDRVLRRSLGVSETAPTDTTVKPAPPVDPELPTEEFVEPLPEMPEPVDQFADNKPGIVLPDHLKDQISIEMEEIDDFGNVVEHDEL